MVIPGGLCIPTCPIPLSAYAAAVNQLPSLPHELLHLESLLLVGDVCGGARVRAAVKAIRAGGSGDLGLGSPLKRRCHHARDYSPVLLGAGDVVAALNRATAAYQLAFVCADHPVSRTTLRCKVVCCWLELDSPPHAGDAPVAAVVPVRFVANAACPSSVNIELVHGYDAVACGTTKDNTLDKFTALLAGRDKIKALIANRVHCGSNVLVEFHATPDLPLAVAVVKLPPPPKSKAAAAPSTPVARASSRVVVQEHESELGSFLSC